MLWTDSAPPPSSACNRDGLIHDLSVDSNSTSTTITTITSTVDSSSTSTTITSTTSTGYSTILDLHEWHLKNESLSETTSSYGMKDNAATEVILMLTVVLILIFALMPYMLVRSSNDEAEMLASNHPQVLQVLRIIYISAFLSSMDLTIIVTTSFSRARSLNEGLSFSGLMIGAVGGGALVVLINLKWLLADSRRSFLLGGVLSIVGNVMYAVAPNPYMLVLSRFLKGVSIAFKTVVSLQLFKDLVVPNTLGYYMMIHEAFGIAGFGSGPLVAGISSFTVPAREETAGAAFMACAATLYVIGTALIMPSQEQVEECKRSVGAEGEEGSQTLESQNPEQASVSTAWRIVISCLIVSFSRAFNRLAWESASAVLFSDDFKLGNGWAGFLIAVPMYVPILSPFAYRSCLSGFTDSRIVQLELLACLLSSLLFYRFTESLRLGIFLFLFGSLIFCPANAMTGAICKSLSFNNAIPGHWALSMEGQIKMGIVFISCGAHVVAPWAMRAVLSFSPFRFRQDSCALVITTATVLAGFVFQFGIPTQCRQREESTSPESKKAADNPQAS